MSLYRPKTFSTIVGICVSVVGVVVLLGWAFQLDRVKSVFPGSVTMKPNTALALALAGLALALLSRAKVSGAIRFCTTTISLGIIALSALTLWEYFLGWKLGIDGLLFPDAITTGGALHPGRMSPSTAFCFILTGSALGIVSQPIFRRLRFFVVSGLGATLVVIGALGTLGQILNALLDFRLWNYFGMAEHTAAGFVLIGSGLVALVGSKEEIGWVVGKTTTAGFIVSIAIMVTAAGFSWNYTNELQIAAAWVSHTHQVLKEIGNVRAGVMDLESGQRGYLILGDENLLAPRQQIQAAIRQSIGELRSLTSDNPHQKPRLDRLEPLIAQRTDFGEQTIIVRRQQGFSAAQKMVATGTGLALSAEIERVLGAMRAEENSLLATREKRAEAVSNTTFLLLPVAVLLSLTILSLALFSLNAGVAERARAEEVAAQLAAIVNSSNDAIIGKNLNSIITSWNLGAERIFGYAAREMIGSSITRLIPLDRQQEELQIINRVRKGECVEHFDTVRMAKDGHFIDISVTVSPIRDKTGKIVGASKVARDITERKAAAEKIYRFNIELEERVAERTAQLEMANKELEAFSYSVSHDLRAPLRAVDGFSQAMLEDYGSQLPPPAQHYLLTIRQGAQRMGNLIDDLLTFSRLSRAPLNKQSVNTDKLVGSVLEDLHSERQGRQIEIQMGELPSCQGDPALLKQVWVNLLSNALKYTRHRYSAVIEIGCQVEAETVYFVRDNGAGFDMRYVHKLFGVFQRLHRADQFEGTGVGLAIVQRIVNRHGGRIWAEAALDRGASFYFTLEEKT
jgi:PAS domain S-box-containing protein